MAYIGKTPVIGNFVKLDSITAVNGQAAYTMQNGGVNFTSYDNVNQFLVSLNGVLQAPTDSFTVSGSTLTFASNLSTGDVIDFVLVLGNSLDIGTPSDNTVSLAKLTATGTKDATTFLRGDNTFAAAGSPSIDDNGNATAITIDSSENVLINTTDTDPTGNNTKGFVFLNDDEAKFSEDGLVLDLNRKGSDGGILHCRKDGTNTGGLGVRGNEIYFFSQHHGHGVRFAEEFVATDGTGDNNDNDVDLGKSGVRWKTVFAGTGSINTSDENEKQSIQPLTSSEMNVAKRLSALFKKYKFNDAVEQKGDNARTHTGIIAQDVQQAFTDEGLDASNYALWCSDTWYQDANGDIKHEPTEGYVEKTRLALRYSELFSFIQAYNDQRFAELETRITALENA